MRKFSKLYLIDHLKFWNIILFHALKVIFIRSIDSPAFISFGNACRFMETVESKRTTKWKSSDIEYSDFVKKNYNRNYYPCFF